MCSGKIAAHITHQTERSSMWLPLCSLLVLNVPSRQIGPSRPSAQPLRLFRAVAVWTRDLPVLYSSTLLSVAVLPNARLSLLVRRVRIGSVRPETGISNITNCLEDS